MLTVAEATALIGAGGALIALISFIVTSRRNAKSDAKSDSADMTTLNVELKNISSGITELKADMRGFRATIMENRERIATVEASAKQAHKRIDNLENRREKA